jgi:hypothetical protein
MNLLNIGGHGLGDCLLSLQISFLLKQIGVPHQNLVSTRKDVFNPLNHIFGKIVPIENIDEKYANDNAILSDSLLFKELTDNFKSENITYNVPDLLFRNPLAFKYKEYGLNPQLIKKTRIASSSYLNKEKIIYCGLSTSTPGYMYKNIPELLKSLANNLPDYKIYFPKIKTWDKDIIHIGDFEIDFPDNVIIDINPKFNDSLDILSKSEYGIFTCNGPSHIAYHLGIPRLVLDPQFGKIPWISRWKEDNEECIDINTDYNNISDIVYHNIINPETLLVDRKIILFLLKNGYNSWKEIFYLKF